MRTSLDLRLLAISDYSGCRLTVVKVGTNCREVVQLKAGNWTSIREATDFVERRSAGVGATRAVVQALSGIASLSALAGAEGDVERLAAAVEVKLSELFEEVFRACAPAVEQLR